MKLIQKINPQIFLKEHVAVIIIFLGLTILFTYPALFHLDEIPGGPRDTLNRMWSMWWFNYAIQESDLNIFSTNYVRYPNTTYLTAESPFTSLLSIPFQAIWEIEDVYKIFVYSSWVLVGYCTFLLAHYLTKNYPASLVAGIIFSFNIYHFFHAKGHLGLVILYFIPLFLLFLLKTRDLNNKKYPILAGIFFCF